MLRKLSKFILKYKKKTIQHSPYASLLINKGANVKIVAKYLGHTKEEETLKTYAHLFLSSLYEIINVIDNLNK